MAQQDIDVTAVGSTLGEEEGGEVARERRREVGGRERDRGRVGGIEGWRGRMQEGCII